MDRFPADMDTLPPKSGAADPSADFRFRLLGRWCPSLFIGFVFGAATPVLEAEAPDLIVHNAVVLTVDPTRPTAEAFSVHRGRFTQVGSDAEVLKNRGTGTRVLDLGGRTVVPGFNDSHLHPRPEFPEDSIHGEVDLDPDRVPDRDRLLEVLKSKAAATPPGAWIRGFNYQDTRLGGHPTRDLLDRVSTNHPILLRHSSGHVWAVNSVVLKAARITRQTPDPKGGAFGRNRDGEPDGVLREPPALRLVEVAGPKTPEPSWDELVEAYGRCFDRFLSEGISSVQDAAGTPKALRIYQELSRRGRGCRVGVLMQASYLDVVEAAGMESGFGDEWVRLGGIKIVHGNSLSGRTCWVSEPYDRVNPATGLRDDFGIPPARTQEELDALVLRVHKAGLQPAIHANGDREIAMVLDAFERALRRVPKADPRFRIEHASICPPPLLRRVKDLGVVLALHSYIHEHGDKMEEYGAARWEHMHPNRSAEALGIVVSGNSDWPVSACKPMRRLQSLVTRTSAAGRSYGGSQRIPLEMALREFTWGSAFAERMESVKGTVSEGKVADFVVLSGDPREAESNRIADIRVESTYVGGVRRFQGARDN
jgi:predicted amidohydrolase YtcJ